MLQLLLEAGALSQIEALDLLKKCALHHGQDARRCNVHNLGQDDKDYAKLDTLMMSDIQPKIEPFGMKLAKARSGADGEIYYGLVKLRGKQYSNFNSYRNARSH